MEHADLEEIKTAYFANYNVCVWCALPKTLSEPDQLCPKHGVEIRADPTGGISFTILMHESVAIAR